MSRWTKQFQLTRPAKNATNPVSASHWLKRVSTHASREERDWLAVGINRSTTFQLTRPAKDATPSKWNLQNMDKVSTHASREGRDLSPSLRLTWLSCFNSCAPQRTRLVLRDKPDNASQFQLTRPAKDATRALVFGAVQALVSTHASREERDMLVLDDLGCETVSTHASSKGRDADNSRRSAREDVSTHASREGRDLRASSFRATP